MGFKMSLKQEFFELSLYCAQPEYGIFTHLLVYIEIEYFEKYM